MSSDERIEGRPSAPASPDEKSADRAMWALGDLHAFAKGTVWPVGPVLVEACAISPGQRVLDVATGTGNVAIRAAEAGARVTACDLTPENFEAGRQEARARGVDIEWVEADAEALPFEDATFDVVVSVFGAMFAPDHQAVANELRRVCRPGGVIGMANFTPDGLAGEFFPLLARYTPPRADGWPPLSWGVEDHVRDLFREGVDALDLTRRVYVERAADPDAYVELYRTTFGPVIGLRELLSKEPVRAAEFDAELEDYAKRANRGAPGEPAEYPYEYLLLIARTTADAVT